MIFAACYIAGALVLLKAIHVRPIKTKKGNR